MIYDLFLVPPSLTTTPNDQILNEKTSATFHCTAVGNPVPKITWTKDGKTVGTGNVLRFETHRNHSGKYWCTADNGFNKTVNSSAQLNVLCKLKYLVCVVVRLVLARYWCDFRDVT